MKVYSRAQVALFSILTGFAAVCVTLAVVRIGSGEKGTPESREPVFKRWELSENTGEDDESALPSFFAAQEPDVQVDKNAGGIRAAEVAGLDEAERENIGIYDKLNESVVNITTEKVVMDWFLQPMPQEGESGSGSIIDERGYVLTNRHVVEGAYKVYIKLADGSQYVGKVVGTDSDNDLAVLQFTPPEGMEVKTMPFGDSASLKVGQRVLAIGNPFGFERTLTIGIVSGLGRPIQIATNRIVRDMIQTDASINPGNSGGPLLDSRGRMIGINTMIYTTSRSGGSVGVGFAIPVNTAKRVVAELIEFGKVRRGWIDATLVQLRPSIVEYAKLQVSAGLLVSRVKSGGLAHDGGLRQGDEQVRYGSGFIYLGGDVITSVDNMNIETVADLFSALEDNKPGDKVLVEVNRDGKTVKLTLTLADREEIINQ